MEKKKIKLVIEDLNSKQTSIVEDIVNTPTATTKWHIVRASRQSGKSYMLVRLAIFFALNRPNMNVGFTSAFHTQTQKIYRDMMEIIPESVISSTSNSSGDRHITFVNGSTIRFYSMMNFNSIMGNSFDYLICDEAALYRMHAFSYLRPTIAAKPKSKIVVASTPRGKNEFYDYCIQGMDNTSTYFKHYRMSYLDNSHYDLREVENARKSMPESVFSQEYEAEFIFGKGQVFGQFSQHQDITAWKPYDESLKYYFGIDWAGDGDDSTVVTIMNSHGEVVYVYESDSTSIPRQVDEIAPILKRYKATGYSEYNGLGKGGTDMVIDAEIANGYICNKWWTSNESKSDAVSLFLTSLNTGGVHLPTAELCPKLDNEMSTYEVSRTGSGKLSYSHPKIGGIHDDHVDSLMLAHKALRDNMELPSDAGSETASQETWAEHVQKMKEAMRPQVESFDEHLDYIF